MALMRGLSLRAFISSIALTYDGITNMRTDVSALNTLRDFMKVTMFLTANSVLAGTYIHWQDAGSFRALR